MTFKTIVTKEGKSYTGLTNEGNYSIDVIYCAGTNPFKLETIRIPLSEVAQRL